MKKDSLDSEDEIDYAWIEQFNTSSSHQGKKTCTKSFLAIDRSSPFSTKTFFGKGSSIVDQDSRSLQITELAIKKVKLHNFVIGGKSLFEGEESFKYVTSAPVLGIRLDAKIFQAFWENQSLIPESWKQPVIPRGVSYIFFDGTIFVDKNGKPWILFLAWVGDRWVWGKDWIRSKWDTYARSAVLVL